MEIKIWKASEAEKANMLAEPTWECGVSEFNWYYDSEETCLLVDGEVTVTHSGGSVTFGVGDMVTFSQGLSCVWKVTKPVKKHYIFK